MAQRPVYLDYQATTPVDPRVRDEMLPFFNGRFGNPHSQSHSYGWEASAAVREARSQVAGLVAADDEDIIFTSGATESCNLALRGVARAADGMRRRVVTVASEHPAVLETVQDLGQMGYETVVLPVGPDGILDLGCLADTLDDRTLIVSVMAVNNETGVIQPLREIAELCRSAGALFHTDATQAAGRMSIDIGTWGVDLLSFSSHKIYGPKGVGGLFVRPGTPIMRITTGGAQEGGLRAGTVPTPLVAGFGLACELADVEGAKDMRRMVTLSRQLLCELQRICPDVRLFGDPTRRVPGNLCIGFPGIGADAVVEGVGASVSISTGSACSSATTEPSRVLLAMGLEPEIAATGVRISLGRFTGDRDIQVAASAFSRFLQSYAF